MRTPKILVAIGMVCILSTTSLISCGGTSKKTYTISGTVSGAIAAGVSVSLTGTKTATATTDGTGAYTFKDLDNGSYTVTPSLAGYAFAPVSLDVVVSNANMSGKDFVAAVSFTISGTVSGDIAAGVGVSLSGAATASTVTDATGAYTFSSLANGSYTVTPSLTGYAFAPVSLDVVVSNANKSGEDFVTAKSCAEICAKIGGTDTNAGQCNSVTSISVDDCTTFCNLYKDILADNAWSQTNDCILQPNNCATNMFTDCITQVATSITNDNLTVLESNICESCQAPADNTACLSSINTILDYYSSYVSVINLINTSTVDCLTTCYQTPSQPCYTSEVAFLGAYNQINACLTQCQIPLQL